jgi:transposase-like protein
VGFALDLAFPISYRDLALMLSDRGVVVDHTTLFRWVQAYAATLALARLWQVANRGTNAGRFRGDGDNQKGAGAEAT